MFYFWRGATAALVPGFLCQSGRRRPENVPILSSLLSNDDGNGKENGKKKKNSGWLSWEGAGLLSETSRVRTPAGPTLSGL